MQERPLVSVVVPAYQAAPYLAQTLRSVLAQTWAHLEVVVVDNASTDATPRLLADVRDERLRVLRNPQTLPLAENWNAALRAARGDLVKLVCADDLLHPDAVARQVAAMADPGVALVASRRHFVDAGGRLIVPSQGLRGLVGRRESGQVAARVVRHGGNPIGEPAAVMFRRRDVEACGGFDPTLPLPMDLELWMRLLHRGAFVGLPEALAAFRVRSASLSGRHRRELAAQQRTLTASIVADPRWRVPGRDVAVGRFGAALARLHREVVFSVARHPAFAGPSRQLPWPPAAQPPASCWRACAQEGIPVSQRPASSG